jgi:hypothetical protein
MGRLSRGGFLKSAGAAVVIGASGPAAAAAAAASDPEHVEPSARVPAEPLVVYVRDARKGELTVLAGKRETTVRDRGLARRLERIARSIGAARKAGV